MSQTIQDSTLKYDNDLKREAPFRTGNLRRCFYTVINPYEGLCCNSAEYVDAVLYGSPPHEILPKNKKALYWDGADHPVKKVMHPGNAPNDFVGRVIMENNNYPQERFIELLQEAGVL